MTARAASPRPTGKRVAMVALAALTLATIATHEAWLLAPADPMWHHLAPFRWWLIPHVAAAAIAFALTPFQFSATIRRHRPAVHRWLGRLYVAAVTIAASLSVYIVVGFEIRANWWVMGTMGGLWLVTTLFGWFAALNRAWAQHRLWMARSFGLTFTFVLTRFVPDTLLPGLDYVGMTALYWGFIVASLILPDIVFNAEALFGRRPVRR